MPVVGQPETVSVVWRNPAGATYDPTVVVVRYMGPGVAVVSVTTPDARIIHTGSGAYSFTVPSESVPGPWYYRWEAQDGSGGVLGVVEGSFSVAVSAFTSILPVGYPYPTGYASRDDVAARILDGTQNFGVGMVPAGQPQASTSSTSFGGNVNGPQVDDFLMVATAQVDTALARAGYQVPPVPASGYLVVGQQVWLTLRNVTAYLAAAMVEKRRHGAPEQSADGHAMALFQYADDLLVRLEEGADNLSQFGMAAAFADVPERGSAMSDAPSFDQLGNDTTVAIFDTVTADS